MPDLGEEPHLGRVERVRVGNLKIGNDNLVKDGSQSSHPLDSQQLRPALHMLEPCSKREEEREGECPYWSSF